MIDISENYNIGLLILIHLLIVAVLELIIFFYVIKPAVKKHMKKLSKDLPKLNEETLNTYGIHHNQTISDSFSSVAQIPIQDNQELATLMNSIKGLEGQEISNNLQSYFGNKANEYEKELEEKTQSFYLKVLFVIIALVTSIIIWNMIYKKNKNVKADIPELVLDNVIPLTIIFIFELYFIQNIAIKYKVMGQNGFLYEILDKLYPMNN